MPSQRTSFSADTSELEALGKFIEAHCQHSKRILIELALIEVVVNAIEHGQASYFDVEIEDAANAFKITINDDGKAFNPAAEEALPMGELREGGYGLGLIQQLSTSSSHSYENGKNKLTLEFEKEFNHVG